MEVSAGSERDHPALFTREACWTALPHDSSHGGDSVAIPIQEREGRPKAATHKLLLYKRDFGGARRNRTADLLNAIQVLSHPSYSLALTSSVDAESGHRKLRITTGTACRCSMRASRQCRPIERR